MQDDATDIDRTQYDPAPDLYATEDGRLTLVLADAMGTELGRVELDDLPPGIGVYAASVSGGPRDE